MHDRIRKEAQRNEKISSSSLIKNGKYFVAPQKTEDNFKVLFARLAAAGAGRPVNASGFPDGPWTPDALMEAICLLEENEKGINLRIVQLWFQDNDHGIGPENIKWLARIFGCDDPEATSVWQAEITASKERLTKERKAKKLAEKHTTSDEAKEPDQPVTTVEAETQHQSPSVQPEKPASRTLAEKTEWILSGSGSMNLLVVYWLVFCGLGFLNYALGTLSVTYNPVEGLSKQVGFIWAPTLNALPLIALPLYIYFVGDLNTYWKRVGRGNCTSVDSKSVTAHRNVAWYAKVNDFSFSFWAIALFCFLFVCCFQWFGIYLPAYLSGDANGVQIDRYLVTLVRPEVISIPEAMILSAIGYLYTASYIAVFMFGLLFLVIVVFDFHDICTTLVLEGRTINRRQILKEGQKIVWGSFRVAVFGLWLATLIKLQVTYLSSDSPNIVQWIKTDALSFFGVGSTRNGWLDNTSITHFTTFLMVVVTATIFVFSVMKVQNIFQRLSIYGEDLSFARDGREVVRMLFVIGLLSVNLVLVGRFDGFSLILALSIIASTRVLSGPKLQTFLGG
ncbi:MAG: RcgA family putative transporter [Pelagimonas sp.]|uniref:RcgA family putative transporter n=1 Tax=Pelagimonas sp. TaxID=2073170 RepID=UPI003D6C1BD8